MATKKKSSSVTDEYAAFLRKLRLTGLGLDKASASLDREALAKAQQDSQKLTLQLNLNESVRPSREGPFVVIMNFELSQKSATGTNALLTITGTYSGLFSCEGSPKKELLERFSGAEARLVFWPYIRQHISDLTSRMSINTILLPLTSEFSQSETQKQ